MPVTIGIDVGGTKIEGVLTTEDGSIKKRLRINTSDHKGPNKFVTAVAEMVEQLAENESPVGVGVGIPGIICSKTHTMIHCPNNKSLEGSKMHELLSSTLDLPVFVENDANCLALSEAHFGAAQGYKNIIAIIIGTGVGGGIICDGTLYRGTTPLAGEIGCMRFQVGKNAPSVEELISGPALEAQYQKSKGLKNPVPLIDIVENARAGEKEAQDVMNTFYEHCALFVANLIHAFDPEIIVCGGGVSNTEELYVEVPKRMKKYLPEFYDVPFVQAQCGPTSGVLGAASLTFRK